MKKLPNLELTTYLDKLLKIQAKTLGPSFIDATCFEKKEFPNNFSNFFEIKKEVILKETKKNLPQILNRWLGKNKRTTNIINQIEAKLGKEEKIYISSKESNLEYYLAGEGKGLSGCFFIDELYFIEYKDYIVCLILGNNE